jgi:hypothetical protein
MTFTEALSMELEAIEIKIKQKNFAYGNSAMEPLRIFSKAPADEQLKIRADDKLSRIKNLKEGEGDTEDSVLDLIGYLLLMRIQRRMLK